ncbi:MAG: 4-hydroxythreonine-4-phosphate dehydrogenase PdxA [Planctomycetaceae bacterium]|nr:4-hydroxythreonine-4-phosphate dehydrogenase PdxA [Planctomycetaceae bacterium]
MNSKTPKLALTMGDPAGIGPEIIVAGWRQMITTVPCKPIVYGHPEFLDRAARMLNLNYKIQQIESPFAAEPSEHQIPCLKACSDDALKIEHGRVGIHAGEAAYHSIITAVIHALLKKVDAIVTAPINKKSLNLAGCNYPGHTELIAERCGCTNFAMMLYLAKNSMIQSPHGLAVVHVTLHTAMQNIFREIRIDTVLSKIKLAHDFMLSIRGTTPKIGVCALNPHAGEMGLFGYEEITFIEPAVKLAQEEGMDAAGPFPADTMMLAGKNGDFDAIVAMYHDQGHIALKLLGMHSAVNITLGLPIIRTSVAHGTAFDRAWQGVAKPDSMIEATRIANILARSRLE